MRYVKKFEQFRLEVDVTLVKTPECDCGVEGCNCTQQEQDCEPCDTPLCDCGVEGCDCEKSNILSPEDLLDMAKKPQPCIGLNGLGFPGE